MSFLRFASTQADACTFNKGVIYDYDKIRKCFNTISYSPQGAEFVNTISTLKSHLSSYAYRDNMLNPPSPHKYLAMDIVKELDDVLNAAHEGGYDFYSNVSVTIAKMKDPHTLFSPPCLSSFYYVLPYSFVVTAAENDETEPTVTLSKHPMASISEQHNEKDPLKLFDRKVTAIAIDGVNYVPGEAPWKTIAKWAEEYVPLSKTPAARFNGALTGAFYFRQASIYPMPPANIKVKYSDTNGNEQEASIPYYAFSTIAFNNLNNACPLQNSNSNKNDNIDFSEPQNKDRSLSKQQKINEIKRIWRQSQEEERNKREEQMQFKRKFEVIPKSDEKPFHKGKSSNNLLSKMSEEEVINFVKQNKNLIRPKSISTSTEIKKLFLDDPVDSNSKNSASSKLIPLINSMPHELHSSAHYTNNITKSDFHKAKAIRYSELVLTPYVVGYHLLDNNFVTLHIVSFSPETDQELVDWLSAIASVVDYALENKVTGLIIDLCSNGGGIVALGRSLLHLLYPSAFPLYGRLDLVKTDANSYLLKTLIQSENGKLTDVYDVDSVITDVFANPRSVTETGLTNSSGNGVTRTREWSQFFAWNQDELDFFTMALEDSWKYFGTQPFDPSNVIILTDGLCGSTCGQFLKQIQEKHLGKIVGRGTNWIRKKSSSVNAAITDEVVGQNKNTENDADDETVEYDVASFSAGNVISSTAIESVVKLMQPYTSNISGILSNEFGLASIPNPFPRKGTSFSYSMTNLYSFDKSTKDQSLEWKVCPADVLLRSYPTQPELSQALSRLQVSVNVMPVREMCFLWQVKTGGGICTDVQNAVAHGIYGHPYTSSDCSYDSTKCVFAGCEMGYYETESGTCANIPHYKYPKKKQADIGLIIVVTVGSTIIVAATIVFIIIAIYQKKKSQRESPF
eukprot:MONOS_983.1-p1 / transcript=MONOS_983.1 / gene=MONOS_983 / organism=Monocercomonoides_exilis_PA203 / gene_product=unspecified product / transcript_product=unspecified product / location=Mono_scaffold00016:147206-150028(-) / protein_length=907 / sequence_SO=supercontig / SO=protein_coding / is_pseudo=false